MSSRLCTFFATLAAACVFALGVQTSVSAQGRGGGGGGGMAGGLPPAGGGSSMGRGPDMNRGRVDNGLNRASEQPGQRPDPVRELARIRRDNALNADKDLRAHPEMAASLRTTADDLREGYRVALALNPTLKLSQYVVATRLALNLGVSHPKVTRRELLIGLSEGHSIRRTLRDLGLGSEEAKEAHLRAEREVKESRRRTSMTP
jgi:hypothetical protein